MFRQLSKIAALGIPTVVDLPAVGSHLTDHVVVTFAAEVHPDVAPEGAPTLQTILRLTASGSELAHDLQITPFVRRHPDGRRSLAMSVSLQRPDGEGSVTPSGSEPNDPAAIRWPFTCLPSNVARLRDGWRTALRIAAASGLLLRPVDMEEALAMEDAAVDTIIAGPTPRSITGSAPAGWEPTATTTSSTGTVGCSGSTGCAWSTRRSSPSCLVPTPTWP